MQSFQSNAFIQHGIMAYPEICHYIGKLKGPDKVSNVDMLKRIFNEILNDITISGISANDIVSNVLIGKLTRWLPMWGECKWIFPSLITCLIDPQLLVHVTSCNYAELKCRLIAMFGRSLKTLGGRTLAFVQTCITTVDPKTPRDDVIYSCQKVRLQECPTCVKELLCEYVPYVDLPFCKIEWDFGADMHYKEFCNLKIHLETLVLLNAAEFEEFFMWFFSSKDIKKEISYYIVQIEAILGSGYALPDLESLCQFNDKLMYRLKAIKEYGEAENSDNFWSDVRGIREIAKQKLMVQYEPFEYMTMDAIMENLMYLSKLHCLYPGSVRFQPVFEIFGAMISWNVNFYTVGKSPVIFQDDGFENGLREVSVKRNIQNIQALAKK